VILLVSAAVMIAVSYATNPPPYEKISGLTYGTMTEEQWRESRASWSTRDVIASAAVLAAILAAYLYFTG
jgi:SSS family solute:Na+ symporter